MEGQDDVASAPGADLVVEPVAELEIDVVGAGVEGGHEQRAPRLLAPAEPPAFVAAPAGDHDRQSPAGDGAGRVGIADRVEPDLHQVRPRRRVPARAQLGRAASGNRRAHERVCRIHVPCLLSQKKSLFNVR